ncbi:MAG: IS5 family transposase [Prevotellaceae bacterium]|jgi:IS5 family transposase|nr:IS5 family transposase [Prevotellaceae bacterium]
MKTKKYFKRHKDYGFWDQDLRLSKISKLGDPLEKLIGGVDFELFRELLDSRLSKIPKGEGGRPPYDYVLMFKILILQRYYNLSDDQVEFQINDRLSFMRFLDLTISDDIPDSRTVWCFKNQIAELELSEELFALFLKELDRLGLIVNEGKIVDASFVEVPRQRNKREENEQIKEGKGEELWQDKPNKKRHKDIDARWTKKDDAVIFGYKNHVKQDSKSKLIVKYMVTSAEVHDSKATEHLLDDSDRGEPFYADSAYTGESQEKIIDDKGMENRVCEKGYRNRPLTDGQKANNREKSRIRSRVEHIFGFMEMSMNEMYINCIGLKRATATIGLMNLTYNMFRKVQLDTIMG